MTDMSPLDRVRAAALALPETEETTSDGLPAFLVAGERFAQVRARDGDGVKLVCVKTGSGDEQATLIEANPAVYARAADLDATGWVGMTLAGDPDWALVEDRIARSWELAAPARLLEAGGR